MINLKDLTTSQLNRIIAIKEQIETLQCQIDSIVVGGEEIPSVTAVKTRQTGLISYAGQGSVAAGARARWAKLKGAGTRALKLARMGKRRLSAAGRAAIIAGTKARWARMQGRPATPNAATKKDRRSSPAVKAKLAAAARARWAKVRAEGKSTL